MLLAFQEWQSKSQDSASKSIAEHHNRHIISEPWQVSPRQLREDLVAMQVIRGGRYAETYCSIKLLSTHLLSICKEEIYFTAHFLYFTD
jgi:hypothetical protein